MYLLTYEYTNDFDLPPAGWRRTSIVYEGFAFAENAYAMVAARAYYRNCELFERRGNDWIRIRPEEG